MIIKLHFTASEKTITTGTAKPACRFFFLLACLTVIFIPNLLSAQPEIQPDTFNFAPRQIHTISEEKPFIITNTGSSPLLLDPSEITLVAAGAQSTGLSVMTYNLWYDSQNWPARLYYMLGEIRELNPDIIGLQEVIQRSTLENQAKALADSLGYYYTFASRDDATSATRFGNAIVSRYPIEETNWRALKPLSDYRTAIHARIIVEGNTIDFYNTHIHNAAVNVHIREEQINDLLDFIASTRSSPYVFVTGDFNTNPDWPEMDLMYNHFHDVYPVFHEDHLDPAHGTLNHHLGHQQRRIDYIFFGKTGSEWLIPATAQVVLDTPAPSGLWGSDHFAVFASFRILSDADAFILNNITETVTLEPSANTEISIAFAPFVVASHQAELKVKGASAVLSGEGFDATINVFPWTEGFQQTENTLLPRGWETNSLHWKTSDTDHAGGISPELVLKAPAQSADTLILHSPLINTTALDSIILSFKQAISIADKNNETAFSLRLVCLADGQEYTVMLWENPDHSPAQEISIELNRAAHGIGNGTIRLAWIFEGVSSSELVWYIDDVSIRALPALLITPASFDFGQQQINIPSEPVSFRLSNKGGGTIFIAPDEIMLSGEHKEAFFFDQITDTLRLSESIYYELMIGFMPASPGEKTATLTIAEKSVPLSGEGFDPTITSLPWFEDFSGLGGGGLPRGWMSNSVHWGAFNANNAGGEAPEMVFWWQPETTGRFYLISPEIIYPETDTLTLSFKHRIRNFGAPGKYTLGVALLANGKEHTLYEWIDPDLQDAEEFSALIDLSKLVEAHAAFQLAWVFDGITDNITQWDIDDIALQELDQSPLLEIIPSSHHFGWQTIQSNAGPFFFLIRNSGGGKLVIHPDDISIGGPDAKDFYITAWPGAISLLPFETAPLGVAFNPETIGEKQAMLTVQNESASLSGLAIPVVNYFVYSDFTIAENGRQYTNVEGFREIPAFARNGSLVANDIAGEGEYGGVILQLAYNLLLTNDYTLYYMWAYPHTDISGYDQLVIYAKASEAVKNIRVQMQDTDGVQGVDGAGFAYFDAGTAWQKIVIPINDMQPMPWATRLPDMKRIQKIDLVFEKETTTPPEAILYVDLVAFDKLGTSAIFPEANPPFSVYPNPANKLVRVRSETGKVISIYDLTGRIVFSGESKEEVTLIDVSNFMPGLYLVSVAGHSCTNVKKLSVY